MRGRNCLIHWTRIKKIIQLESSKVDKSLDNDIIYEVTLTGLKKLNYYDKRKS